MNHWPQQDETSMNAFYGDPDQKGVGQPDAAWESANLIKIMTPFPMYYGATLISGLRVHRKVAQSLTNVLSAIAKDFTPAEIADYQLNKTGGAYNFRLKRGGTTRSIHSWGAAVDMAPDLNPFGAGVGTRPRMMPIRAVKLFEAEGWTWGGLWRTADGMHFQAANL